MSNLRGKVRAASARPLDVWRRWAALHEPDRGRVALGIATLVAQAAFLVAVPVVVRQLILRIEGAQSLAVVVVGGLLLAALYAISGVLSYFGRIQLVRAGNAAGLRLRDLVATHVFRLSSPSIDRADPARLETVAVEDVERAVTTGTALLASMLPAALLGAVLCLAMLVFDLRLAALTAATVPLLWFADRRLGAWVRATTGAYHASHAAFNHRYTAALRALKFLQAQAASDEEVARERALATRLCEDHTETAIAATAYGIVQNTLVNAASAIVLVVGGMLVVLDTLVLGDLLAFYVTLMLAKNYVISVLQYVPAVFAGTSALQAIYEVLDLSDEAPYAGSQRLDFSGRVEARGVSFAYGKTVVLDQVSLGLEPGSVVAVRGANGVGKTTLLNLLLGLDRPSAGSLLADGVAFEQLDLADLRRQIGYVPQEPLFLPGTVRHNLLLGRREFHEPGPEASDEALDKALDAPLRRAKADAVIAKLADGLDSDVGEAGQRLSGGERQRLAIARALVGEPRLLVLDEPTNHLDADAIRAMVETLLTLPSRPAILLITHDREVARIADRSLLLQAAPDAGAQPQLIDESFFEPDAGAEHA